MEYEQPMPAIPAEKQLPEITVKGVVLAILLALILGAANVYLGLKVGLTVSASIPAAVISMGLLRFFSQSNILENNMTYINLNQKCEPNLGTRGIYKTISGQQKYDADELAVLWVLNLSDGTNSLLDISIRSNISFERIKNVADILVEKKLLTEKTEN